MKTFNYEITDTISTITSKETGKTITSTELNTISWNGSSEKYDLRNWSTDKETGERTPYKGITLDAEQLQALYTALKGIFE
jgi:hypothetical protein